MKFMNTATKKIAIGILLLTILTLGVFTPLTIHLQEGTLGIAYAAAQSNDGNCVDFTSVNIGECLRIATSWGAQILLEFFGLANLSKRLMHTLSAGQVTRVMLVKAF